MSKSTIQELNHGRVSREHVITWVTMATALAAILAQVAAKLALGVDLGIDIDTALVTGFGSGAAYTTARMVIKTGVALAEGKVKASQAAPAPPVTQEQPSPFSIPAPRQELKPISLSPQSQDSIDAQTRAW